MNLFSQEKALKSTATYIYIIIGALSSLLILFLARQSLSLNQQQSKHKIWELEKSVLQLKDIESTPDSNLNSQLNNTKLALEKLQDSPEFLDTHEQKAINSQLETQEILLATQAQLIKQFNNAKATVIKSASSIPNIKRELNEGTVDASDLELKHSTKLTQKSLTVMFTEWRSQLYDTAVKVNAREILQLLSKILEEYETVAQKLKHLVEHFRCDKIIDLTESP